jgi:hypothetical protein
LHLTAHHGPTLHQVCSNYGIGRDDAALLHYGYLMELTSPPMLLGVDHHHYKSETDKWMQYEFDSKFWGFGIAAGYAAEMPAGDRRM